MNIFGKLKQIFTKNQKMQVVFLLIAIIIGSFIELVGVSAIMPLVNVVVDSDTINSNKLINFIYKGMGLTSEKQLLIVLSSALIIIYIIKNIYLSILYYVQYAFVNTTQRKMAYKLMNGYLKQPYLYHVKKNSAELQRNIVNDVGMFMAVVLGGLELATETCVCIVLCSYLFLTDVVTTVTILVLLLTCMILFLKPYNKLLKRYGQISRNSGAKMIQWINQALGGIKEVKLLERESFFLNNFDNAFKNSSNAQKNNQFFTVLPRFVMETVCITGLLGTVLIKVVNNSDMQAIMPQLSVFAIASFRLLPSFNRISTAMSKIYYNRPAVLAIYDDLKEINELTCETTEKEAVKSPIILKSDIALENISFHYPNSDKEVLENVSIHIPKGKSIALIGTSGAGKTTLADILLGVLQPQKGTVLVDGVDISNDLHGWHGLLGYIPQSIYLMDDTIENNIAFGIAEKDIDKDRIWRALKEAQLEEFINGLEQGIDTEIGEAGVRLSGGQRQRIGIARALYNEPQILVLDEATSALDSETEVAVMEAIDNLHGRLTLVIIAHRLTTIKNCDYIYEVSGGQAILKKYTEVNK